EIVISRFRSSAFPRLISRNSDEGEIATLANPHRIVLHSPSHHTGPPLGRSPPVSRGRLRRLSPARSFGSGSTLVHQTPNHMSSIVPLIPCNVSGPLGVLHLPRLWLKVSLEA